GSSGTSSYDRPRARDGSGTACSVSATLMRPILGAGRHTHGPRFRREAIPIGIPCRSEEAGKVKVLPYFTGRAPTGVTVPETERTNPAGYLTDGDSETRPGTRCARSDVRWRWWLI